MRTVGPTIYHHGSCPLSRKEIPHYRRQQGAETLTFVDVSDPACDLGSDLDRRAAMGRFHVRMPDGRLQSGAAGFAAVWHHLPAWRWPARLTRLPGMLTALEVGYRLSLPARPLIAGMVTRFTRR